MRSPETVSVWSRSRLVEELVARAMLQCGTSPNVDSSAASVRLPVACDPACPSHGHAGGRRSRGVWFPEEQQSLADRRTLLSRSIVGATRFELNKPPWALEGDPVRPVFGM
jgi:hypothetical protein